MNSLCPSFSNSTSQPPINPPASMTRRIGFTVSGTVQGPFYHITFLDSPGRIYNILDPLGNRVNFRYFTQKKAKSYGVIGWVRNTDDGKVSGEAQGNPSSIEKLIGDLKNGPRHAQVTNYEERDLDIKGDGTEEKSFEVVR
ncbi:Acylphosphatase family protein [Sclerotinia borealis F-4128]|uniref:acylphosphatase n=1 Tax=Sclerotinia borealis (strain F-4128) TaxID=1432307 RepID=W9C8F3_SCLBF|nr:Acylphosphatase family protein [Sclerotinia borealis F-4128]